MKVRTEGSNTKVDGVWEYVDARRDAIERSRNARRWFYRGVITTLALSYVCAVVGNKQDKTEESA